MNNTKLKPCTNRLSVKTYNGSEKQDCFAYAKEKGECTALKFVLCKREECPFYKREREMRKYNGIIDRLKIYAEEYRKPPLGREIEGTAELLEETAEYIEELANGTNDGSKSEFFEKVLKEKLSAETFAFIAADEQVFGKVDREVEECCPAVRRVGGTVGKDGLMSWIQCSDRMPEAEVEVLILAKRKWISGEFKFIITTAIYEDGTVRENDSCWNWQDIDGEWDEEEDCYIAPEGWWENRHYNPDEAYNNIVDDEVIAWMPLPEPYTEKD